MAPREKPRSFRRAVGDDRAMGEEGGPIIVTQSPDGRVQVDVGTPEHGLAYVELTPENARKVAREMLRLAGPGPRRVAEKVETEYVCRECGVQFFDARPGLDGRACPVWCGGKIDRVGP